MPTSTPHRTEAAEYYFTYIDQAGPGPIVETLQRQAAEVRSLFETVSEQRSLGRYEPGKWSIREVVAHLNDTERLFVFRALWFARGFDTPLPSFDQHVAIASSGADARSWRSLVDEFAGIRASTIAFFASLPAEAWGRRGVASDNPFTVRALCYLAAGHVTHHTRLLRERYLVG